MAAEVTPQQDFEFHPVTPDPKIVEGYAKEAEGRLPGGSEAYAGIASVFREAGLVEALRRAERQPIMRYLVRGISSR